jgi:hypothetical protein
MNLELPIASHDDGGNVVWWCVLVQVLSDDEYVVRQHIILEPECWNWLAQSANFCNCARSDSACYTTQRHHHRWVSTTTPLFTNQPTNDPSKPQCDPIHNNVAEVYACVVAYFGQDANAFFVFARTETR